MCGRRPLFALRVLAWMRRLDERSRSQSATLALILANQRRMEIKMSDITDRLDKLKAEVDAYTSDRAAELAAALDKAKKAWEADNQAEHDAAMAKIDEISGALKSFSPSAN